MSMREISILERTLRRSVPWNLSRAEINVLARECQNLDQAHAMLLEYPEELRLKVEEEQRLLEEPDPEASIESQDAIEQGREEEEE